MSVDKKAVYAPKTFSNNFEVLFVEKDLLKIGTWVSSEPPSCL